MNTKQLQKKMQYNPATGDGWEWDADYGEWVLYHDDFAIEYSKTAPWDDEDNWSHLIP